MEASVPDWVSSARVSSYVPIHFTDEAEAQLQHLNCAQLDFYSDVETLRAAIVEALQHDPRSTLQQKKQGGDLTYEFIFLFDSLRISFWTDQDSFRIFSIVPETE